MIVFLMIYTFIRLTVQISDMIRENKPIRLHGFLHAPLQVAVAILEQERHPLGVS